MNLDIMSLKFRREEWAGEISLGVVSMTMVFIVIVHLFLSRKILIVVWVDLNIHPLAGFVFFLLFLKPLIRIDH